MSRALPCCATQALDMHIAAAVQAGQPELVEQFGHMFDGVQFRKGLTMTFTTGKGGDLITAVDDKEVRHSVAAQRRHARL